MKHLLLALSLLCLPAAILRAEDLPKVKATEEKAIRDLIGKKATVAGRVASAKEAKNGMTFLDFEGGKFTVVAWKDDYAKFEGGSPAKLYAKKEIEVTGTIIEYRAKNAKADAPGKLEIKLNSPEQVKILEGKAPAPPASGDGKESQNGKAAEGKEKPAAGSKDPAPNTSGEKPADRVDPKKFFK